MTDTKFGALVRWSDLDLPDHPAMMPDCWRCAICKGFFYRPLGQIPVECPYCVVRDGADIEVEV